MIKRYFVSIGGRVGAAILQLCIVGLIGRGLGVADFGIFAAAMSLTLGAMSFAELGMGARVLRGVRSPGDRTALSTFAVVRFSVLLAVPLIATVWAVATGAHPLIIVVAACYAAGEATGDLAVGILQGDRRSTTAMAVLIGRRFMVLLPLLLWPSLAGVIAGTLAGACAGGAVFAFIIMRRWVRPQGLFTLMRENAGIIFSGGATSASQLDVLIVGAFVGPYMAGLYASAQRLFNPINLAVSTMLQVLVPEIASEPRLDARIRLFRRARIVVFFAAMLVASGSFFAPAIVTLIFGEEFAPAAPIASAIFIAAAMSAFAQVHLAWLYSTYIPRSVPICMWISVIAGLLGLGLLGGALGVVGLSAGVILLQAMIMSSIVVPCLIQIKSLRE